MRAFRVHFFTDARGHILYLAGFLAEVIFLAHGSHRIHVHFGLHVGQLVTTQIADGQLAEDIVEDRGRHLDVIVADDGSVGLKTRERECVYELFKLLMIERSAAPSLCMSMKISPSCPPSYSPVRR